jgi:hypothetical protein
LPGKIFFARFDRLFAAIVFTDNEIDDDGGFIAFKWIVCMRPSMDVDI